MKLIVKCKNCRAENQAPDHAYSRVNYAHKHGEEFSLTCYECNQTNNYEVDDIRAVDYGFMELVKNRIVILSLMLIVDIVLQILFFNSAAISFFIWVMPILTILVMKRNDSKKQLAFNRHKYKGGMTNIGNGSSSEPGYSIFNN